MRKIIAFAVIVQLTTSWSSYSSVNTMPSALIKKKTVVLQIIEKKHVPVEQTMVVDGINVTDGTRVSTDIAISKYNFTYNALGQLTTIHSYLFENDQSSDPFITTIELNDANQLDKILFENNKMRLDFSYENTKLRLVALNDLLYNHSQFSSIIYNQLDLPDSITITSDPQYEATEIKQFSYDANNNVKVVTSDSNKTTYTYDDKKYPLAYLPYAFNISNYLSAYELSFSNYVQQNNVIKAVNNYFITTIDYTYNAQSLPLTAKIKTVDKSNPTEALSQYDYAFIYKEIDVTE